MLKKRVDGNQPEIVEWLRDEGFTVESLHKVGRGVPDLLIGDVLNFLIEIKSKGGHMRKNQIDWHDKWKGHSAVARNKKEVLEKIAEAATKVSEEIQDLILHLEEIRKKLNDEDS